MGDLFPPAGLVLRVGGGPQMRYATDDLRSALAQAAYEGVHDLWRTPFTQPWASAVPMVSEKVGYLVDGEDVEVARAERRGGGGTAWRLSAGAAPRHS